MTDWVCLDIGEVLVDETRIWTTWAEVLGIPAFTFMATLGGAIERGGDHRDAFTLLGVADWRDCEAAVQDAYGGFRAEDLYDDVLPTLDALRTAGLRVAVIGNQPARRHDELHALGVRPDVMVMSETLRAEKPSPEFFALALEAMDGAAAADVLYVGDRVDNDIVPAAAAGLHTAWLRRGPWGVLQRDVDGVASVVLGSLAELPGRLAR